MDNHRGLRRNAQMRPTWAFVDGVRAPRIRFAADCNDGNTIGTAIARRGGAHRAPKRRRKSLGGCASSPLARRDAASYAAWHGTRTMGVQSVSRGKNRSSNEQKSHAVYS